jgi:hypothetical protein
MNRIYRNATHFAVRMMQTFVAKLSQNPEFYNIRYYKKMKSRNRGNDMLF